MIIQMHIILYACKCIICSSKVLKVNLFVTQVKHKEELHKLQLELDDARATIDAQKQRLQKIQTDSKKSSSSWGQVLSPDKKQHHAAPQGTPGTERGAPTSGGSDSPPPVPPSSSSSSSSPPSPSRKAAVPPLSAGRWTAERAEQRKVRQHYPHLHERR